ncbi:unnamed protein product [Rotaria sp. Silwood1]|nr:unnamed protein product [Rotaria sp. Silwood1]
MPPWPRDVFVTQKHIYVAESGSFRVLRLSKKGSNAVAVAGVMNEVANFFDLTKIGLEVNLFVDNNENLYVSDTISGKVLWFPSNSTSGFPGVIVAGSTMPGEDSLHLYRPHGIFVSEVGTIYVADAGNHRIQRWGKGASFGVTVAGTGKAGSNLNELNLPTDVVVDSKEYMYIVDALNNRVLRWPPDSAYGECIVACSGSFGNHPHMLKMPTSMAFDSYGSLFIVDSLNSRIQKFQILEKFDQYTTPPATKPTKTSVTKSTTTETTSITTATKLTATGPITPPTAPAKTTVIGTTSITTATKLTTIGPITPPTAPAKTTVIGTTSITTATKLTTIGPITPPTTPTKTTVIGTTSITTATKLTTTTTTQTISMGLVNAKMIHFYCLSCGILSDQYTTPPATKPTKTSVTKSTTTDTTSITTAPKLTATGPITPPTTPTKTAVIGTTSITTAAKSTTTTQTISMGCNVRSMKINISIVLLVIFHNK